MNTDNIAANIHPMDAYAEDDGVFMRRSVALRAIVAFSAHPTSYVEGGVVFHWLSDVDVITHELGTQCEECEGWESGF